MTRPVLPARALRDLQERLPPALVAPAAALLLGVVLGLARRLLGAPRALAQVAGVEVAGRDRLLDQHDELPESAFFMKGGIDQVVEAANKG